MSVYSATSVNSATTASDVSQRIPKQALGQEDFLKLLVTQLTAQDPLNPQKDMEFIAQMAQFSSLDQTNAMSREIAALRADQKLANANALLGQAVVLQDGPESFAEGRVQGVELAAGEPALVVNGEIYRLDQVVKIAPFQVA